MGDACTVALHATDRSSSSVATCDISRPVTMSTQPLQQTKQRRTGDREHLDRLCGLWPQNHVKSARGDLRERGRGAAGRTDRRNGGSTVLFDQQRVSNCELDVCIFYRSRKRGRGGADHVNAVVTAHRRKINVVLCCVCRARPLLSQHSL